MINLKLEDVCLEKNVAIHCPEKWQEKLLEKLGEEKGLYVQGENAMITIISIPTALCSLFKNITPFSEAVQVYLYNQPLNIGDRILCKKTSKSYFFKGLVPRQYKVRAKKYSFFGYDFVEVGGVVTKQLFLGNDCLENTFAWQNPYELITDWKVKPTPPTPALVEYPFSESKGNTMCHYCKYVKIHEPDEGCPIARCECKRGSFNLYTGNKINLCDKNMGDCPIYEPKNGVK